MLFTDRREAGRVLATRLRHLASHCPLVLALPRGGVPVGYEVAQALGAPLDVLIVRKLGVPGHEELAMGAIAAGGAMVCSRDLVQHLGITPTQLREAAVREGREVLRREQRYRGARPVPPVRGREVLLVDDGLATGSTMRAALKALKALGAARLVVSVPVASAVVCRELEREADEVVCAATPEPFEAVGVWYGDFSETPDAEVIELLQRAWSAEEGAGRRA